LPIRTSFIFFMAAFLQEEQEIEFVARTMAA
jgi:hypothetical protein